MKNLFLFVVFFCGVSLSAAEAQNQSVVNSSDVTPTIIYHHVDLSRLTSRYAREFFREKASDVGLFTTDNLDIKNRTAQFYRKSDTQVSDELITRIIGQCVESDQATPNAAKEVYLKHILSNHPLGNFFDERGKELTGPGDPGGGEVQQCSDADVFCGSNAYQFPAGTGSGNSAQQGPYYGCLGSQPNPAWYFMQILNPGPITIYMYSTPEKDIDFICWGPFDSPTGACETGLTEPNVIDCSYSSDPYETCEIPNAIAGKFYILLITNFSGQACNITFSQTGGTGTTNCNIVINCSMLSISHTVSACNPSTNTFSVSGEMEFSNPPSTGTMVISDNTGVSQTFSPPFSSPKSYTLNNIPCDGAAHTLTAHFTADAACTLTQGYNAPQASCPIASIKGGGEICDDGSTTPVNIAIAGGVPPYDFTYAINGNPTTVTGYTGSTYVIDANIPGDYTLVSIQNALCPGTVSGLATVVLHPLPVVNLGADTALCYGGSILLDAGAGFNAYQWNTTAITQTIHVTTAGTYSVQVTDNNECSNTDEITVDFHTQIDPKSIRHN